MSRLKTFLLLCLASQLFGNSSLAQFVSKAPDAPAIAKRSADDQVETMLLGVYHFNNPGVEARNIGSELVGKWYTRNIKIFSNLVREIDQQDERILVIFGLGHIRPIKHFCEDHPTLKLVEPNEYLVPTNSK